LRETGYVKKLMASFFIAPLMAGCVFMVAGGAGVAGAYIWKEGNLARHYTAPMEMCWDATMTAMQSLRLKIDEQKHDRYKGSILATMHNNEKLWITLERWTDRETRVMIRAGALGDRELSERVHVEIEKALR